MLVDGRTKMGQQEQQLVITVVSLGVVVMVGSILCFVAFVLSVFE